MAARSVATLALSVVARTGGLRKGLARAAGLVDRFAARGVAAAAAIGRLGISVAKLGVGLAALGATVGVVGLIKTFSAISSVAKTARKLGSGVNELQAFRDAAAEAGIKTETLDMAFQRATRRISEAAKGQGEAQGALKELGLNPQILQMKTFEERMIAIGTAMQKFGSEDQLRLAFKLFDSEGAVLVNMFTLLAESGGKKGVAGGFAEFREELTRTGREIDQRSGSIERLLDRFKRFGDVIRGVFVRLALGVGPALDRLLARVEAFITRGDVQNALAAGVKALAGWISQALSVASRLLEQRNTWAAWGKIVADVRGTVDGFVSGLGSIVSFGQTIIATFQNVWDTLSRIFNNLRDLIQTVIDMVRTLGEIAGIVGVASGKKVAKRFEGARDAITQGNLSTIPGEILNGIGNTTKDAVDALQGKSALANAGLASATGVIETATRLASEDIDAMGFSVGDAVKSAFPVAALGLEVSQSIAQALRNTSSFVVRVVGR